MKRSLIKGGTLGAGVILAAALLLIVNYFGWKYYHRFDWTRSQIYTLSEKTENALKSVDRDIDAVVLMRAGEELYGRRASSSIATSRLPSTSTCARSIPRRTRPRPRSW
jgi:hypothetical protein